MVWLYVVCSANGDAGMAMLVVISAEQGVDRMVCEWSRFGKLPLGATGMVAGSVQSPQHRVLLVPLDS